MAIVSDYGTLKSEMTLDLFHPRLLGRYDSAINRFEQSANSRLRVRQMEARTLLTTVDGEVALPADYLLWRTIKYPSRYHPGEIEYVHPAYLPPTTVSGSPPLFTIEGGTFKVRPVDGTAGAWDFHYYQKIPTIVTPASDNTATNWLITEYPNAYIFGVMTELAGIMRNLEMAQLYKARRDETFAEIIQLSALTTGATSPQVRTAEYF